MLLFIVIVVFITTETVTTQKTIEWAGYQWFLRDGDSGGPGKDVNTGIDLCMTDCCRSK